MKWAFWRKRRAGGSGPLPVDGGPPSWAGGPATRDEPDEDRPVTPAFSGASPQPGGAGLALGELAVHPDLPTDPDADGPLDLTGVRADVLALVQAALDRDTPAADGVVRRLGSRGEDGAGLASIAAMGGLGDRLTVAAGHQRGGAAPAAASVVARGDALAARAAIPLRAVAPTATPDLVRFVVRFACGEPDADPDLLPLMETPSDDLTRVAAGLLAQTVLDGQGDTDALARELADLLPD